MSKRRKFLKVSLLGMGAVTGSTLFTKGCTEASSPASGAASTPIRPMVIATWNHGIAANEAAWKVLEEGGRALDAVEQGVRVTEADPEGTSVGIGGFPDRTGVVSLDACIMDEKGDCGSVAFLQDIKHPISVARRVMEKTPHVMLVGAGAQEFAISEGFEPENLLTPKAEAAWKKWLASNDPDARQEINAENHDTIGMVALDASGNLSGACTTSGAAWKLHGRVGDSPIIGAGLYVDNEVGGAAATGWGEAVIRVVGCHLVVEFMRQGHDPETACRMAVERVIAKNPDYREIQVGFIALNKQGDFGGYCIQPGFDYAIYGPREGNRLLPASSAISK